MGRLGTRTSNLPAWLLGWAAVLWLMLLCILALFHGLFSLTPLDKTEALQIGIAETMFRLQSWVVPQWNDHLYYDKPPLPYWLAALVWHRFGITPEWARIPAALSATLGVASLAWMLHRASEQELPPRQSWSQAALGGSLLALSPGWIGFAHAAVHDIYLATAVSMGLLGYAAGFYLNKAHATNSHSAQKVWALWIGVWCGIGFLSKGLLGIALPLLIIGVDLLLTANRKTPVLRPACLIWLGGGLGGVISPWLTSLIIGGRWDYLKGFLGFSHLQRATQAVDGHDQPLLFYLPILLALIWPWWPLLLSGLLQLWQGRTHWRQPLNRSARLAQLSAIWLIVVLALFTLIPTKLPGYILPAVPAGALVIATAPRQPAWGMRLVALQLGLLNLLLLAGLIAARQGILGPYGSQLLQTSSSVIGLTILWGLGLMAAIVGWLETRASQRWLAVLLSMVMVVLSLPSLAKPYRQLEQQPVLELAQTAHQVHGPIRSLYVVGSPRYSVVTQADMPTIFSSPLKQASPRPISSYANWLRFAKDHEALVLGSCRTVERLKDQTLVSIEMLERRRHYCLARLHRNLAP